jgi:hypothetical protein
MGFGPKVDSTHNLSRSASPVLEILEILEILLAETSVKVRRGGKIRMERILLLHYSPSSDPAVRVAFLCCDLSRLLHRT